MRATLKAGATHRKRYVVPESKVVAELYPEAAPMQAMPRVFATGFLVGLLEWACIEAINPHLDWPREQTVGTAVEITHEAPTPPGLEVLVTVTLAQIDGRRLVFEVHAADGHDTIARGRHERTVIDRDRFSARADRKRVRARAGTAPRSAPVADVRVIALDVFGTTVDWWTGVSEQVSALSRHVGVPLDGGAVAERWREQYLPSMARVNRGERPWAYLDTLHRETLDALLESLDVAGAFDEAHRRQLVAGWHRLPAWSDVAEGLRRLRTRYTVAAFSNGGFALLTELLKHNRLSVDAVVSAENARAYKPAPQAYRTLTELLDVDPHEVLMVACHGWDLAGARAAGLRTAFVARPREKGPNRRADTAADAPSDLAVRTFTELADALAC